MRGVLIIERRAAKRRDVEARIFPHPEAERRRREGRAEGGQAHVRRRTALVEGEAREAHQVRGLALIRGHAERRIALHVLDRAVALPPGEVEVGQGHVVLRIDEHGLQVRPRRRRKGADARVHRLGLDHGRGARSGAEAQPRGRFQPCAPAVRHHVGETGLACTGACADLALPRRDRREHAAPRVPVETAPRLHVQMDAGIKPAGDGDKVGLKAARATARQHFQPLRAARSHQGGAGMSPCHHLEPFPRPAQDSGADLVFGAEVGDPGDLHACAVEGEGGAIGVVGAGRDHRACPRLHGEAVDIGARGAREHHAGPVVLGEGQGPLDGALGQHHRARPHPPHALGDVAGGRLGPRLSHPLGEVDHVVIVKAERRRAEKKPRAQSFKLGHSPCDPVSAGLVGDGRRIPQQGAAGSRIEIAQGDAGAGSCGGEGCAEARRPRPHHQHVAEGGSALIGVGVRQFRRLAEARGGADGVLVQFPERRRPKEGLVIEARRDERRDQLVDRHGVELKQRPAVLAMRVEAVIEEQIGRPGVGLEPPADACAHQGARLLDARREQAPGAVILEAAAEEANAIGQQRRG